MPPNLPSSRSPSISSLIPTHRCRHHIIHRLDDIAPLGDIDTGTAPTGAKSLAELAGSVLEILVVARVLGRIAGGVPVGTDAVVDAGGLVERFAAAVGVEVEVLRDVSESSSGSWTSVIRSLFLYG